MKKNISFILILYSLFAFPQKSNIKKHLISKDKLGLNNSNLKIDGFYYTKYIDVYSKKDSIKYIFPIFLFENGTLGSFDYLGNGSVTLRKKVLGKKCILKMPNKKDFKKVVSFLKCYAPSIKYKKAYNFFYVNKNIIITQTLYKNKVIESRGIILNDSTFIIKKRLNYFTKKIDNVNLLYHFEKSIKPSQPEIEKL